MTNTAHSTTPTPPPIADREAFKQAFRRHAAGVAIVTARTPDGAPVGFTASSLASLAVDPPLASFNMARISTAWPAIEHTEHVLVHILGARNRALADRLSGPHEHRFDGEHWTSGPLGLPLLLGVHAWMLGRIVGRHPHDGNGVVVVQIEDGALGAEDDALLYHERDYHRLRPLD